MLEIKNQYSKPRLTEISDQKIDKEIDHKLLTKNEDFYLYITKDGYYKKISLKVYTSNELNTFKLKEEDNVFYFDKVNSLSKILFFTNLEIILLLTAICLKIAIEKILVNIFHQ